MKRNPTYQVVELFDDGTELVRHSGSYRVCAYILLELHACGFRAEVRLAPPEATS